MSVRETLAHFLAIALESLISRWHISIRGLPPESMLRTPTDGTHSKAAGNARSLRSLTMLLAGLSFIVQRAYPSP